MTLPATGYLRLPQIIGDRSKGIPAIIPVSQATWFRWIEAGKAPAGVLLSERVRAWSVESINELVQRLGGPLMRNPFKRQAARIVTNDCLFKRHSECWSGGILCDCYCHVTGVAEAMLEAMTSITEPAFDYENSLPGVAVAERGR